MFTVTYYRPQNTAMNKKAIAKFDEAIKYLSDNSLFAKDLLLDLKHHSKVITIKVNFGEAAARDNGWVGPKFDTNTSGGEVTWNAAREKTAGKRSAALGLMHELGHAFQFISEKGGMKRVLKPRFFGRCYRTGKQAQIVQTKDFIENIEDTNVAAIELTVANEINNSLRLRGADESMMEPTRRTYLE